MTKFYVDADGSYIGGFDGAEPPSGSIEVPSPPYDARQTWDFSGEQWNALVEDTNATKAPYIWGIGNFTISDYEIGGIELSVGFSAALYLDTGLYYLFFTETLPNTTYLAKAYDASALVRVSEKGQDYIAITATDTGGNAVDPSEISVEIIRVS